MSFKVMVFVLGYDDRLIDYGDGCIILIYQFSLSPVPSLTIFSLPLLKCNAEGSIPCCQSKELKRDVETS